MANSYGSIEEQEFAIAYELECIAQELDSIRILTEMESDVPEQS